MVVIPKLIAEPRPTNYPRGPWYSLQQPGYGYQTSLIGYHIYLGRNRWLLPSGRIKTGQIFHRRMLRELDMGLWRILE